MDGTILYYHDGAGFGILLDARLTPHFFHLSSFAGKGNRTAHRGQRCHFSALTAGEPNPFMRSHVVTNDTLQLLDEGPLPEGVELISEMPADAAAMASVLESNSPLLVFAGLHFSDELALESCLEHSGSLMFLNCHFDDNLLLIDNHIAGDLYLLGCRFSGRFSLKNCRVGGEVHLNASDFSGVGGASFRGLHCSQLFLDFGVTGPDDMVWLNEMTVPGNVVLGGRFVSDIQLLGDQDGTVQRSIIGELHIGKEYYGSQDINRTSIEKSLTLAALDISGGVTIENARLAELTIRDVAVPKLLLSDSLIEGSLAIHDSRFHSQKSALTIQNSIVTSRFICKANHIDGLLSLDGSTVDKTSVIDNCTFGAHGALSVYDFVSDSLRIEPVEQLYKGHRTMFTNPRFRLLQREQNTQPLNTSERKALAQEYTSLRKWLGDTGLLIQEDEAFYSMRYHSEPSMAKRLLFNHIFGWGVRLWNVLWSSLGLVIFYALLYGLLEGLNAGSALLLSLESFFNIISGDWSQMSPQIESPSSLLSLLLVTEGILGVLFITVLIGAYMRKLLR